jgi:hypothetical protein
VGALSPFHLIILVVEIAFLVMFVMACVRILQRLGYSGWWVLLGLVPIGNVIGLWQLSRAKWPALKTTVFD